MKHNLSDMRQSNSGHRLSIHNIRRSIVLGRQLMNRISDVSRRMDFTTESEFIRYAVRKELDYQAELLYMPQIKKEDVA